MRALTGELLLSAWDQCASEHDVNRAVLVLALSLPGSTRQEISELPLGERNLQLARLHAATFGPWLNGFAACDSCGANLEFRFSVVSLMAQIESHLAADARALNADSTGDSVRPVNSSDLLAVVSASDLAQAQELLLRRCLLSPVAADPAKLTPEALHNFREKFNRVNQAAEVMCAADCPACSNHQVLDFDLARFLWLEIKHAARRLMRDIHDLAQTYGWSEQSIATMNAERRNAYLELANA
jgi:hypothetical protein